jgi:hypothetical protein
MDNDQERQIIYDRILLHIPDWASVLSSPNDITIQRLSGLSNAVFKVDLNVAGQQKKTVLYRRFEQTLTDRRIENTVFQLKSDDGSGP